MNARGLGPVKSNPWNMDHRAGLIFLLFNISAFPTFSLSTHISVNPPEAPKELVIPLIQNGSRRQPQSKSPKPPSETRTELVSDGVLSLAVKELIEGK